MKQIKNFRNFLINNVALSTNLSVDNILHIKLIFNLFVIMLIMSGIYLTTFYLLSLFPNKTLLAFIIYVIYTISWAFTLGSLYWIFIFSILLLTNLYQQREFYLLTMIFKVMFCILIFILVNYCELTNIDNYTNSFSMLVLTNKCKFIFKNFIHIFNKGDKLEEENLLRRKRRGRILKDENGEDIENILDDPTRSKFLWDNHPNGRSLEGDNFHAWKVLQHLRQQGLLDEHDNEDIDNNITNIIENNDIYNKNSPIHFKNYRWGKPLPNLPIMKSKEEWNSDMEDRKINGLLKMNKSLSAYKDDKLNETVLATNDLEKISKRWNGKIFTIYEDDDDLFSNNLISNFNINKPLPKRPDQDKPLPSLPLFETLDELQSIVNNWTDTTSINSTDSGYKSSFNNDKFKYISVLPVILKVLIFKIFKIIQLLLKSIIKKIFTIKFMKRIFIRFILRILIAFIAFYALSYISKFKFVSYLSILILEYYNIILNIINNFIDSWK